MTHSEKAMQLTHDELVALLAAQENLQRAFTSLKVDYDNLKHQLDWFKKQLFGQKSERRPVEPSPNQLSLGEVFEALAADAATTQEQPVAAHVRKKNLKNPMADAVAQTGLRFGPEVPVQEIRLEPSETKGRAAGEYDIIDEKITYRLAQQPGSYVVLKYIRPVIKLKEANSIVCHPAPVAVVEKSYADVSFLAGMLVDKFVYHQPLYRQHQKLKANHIELSRITLTNQTHSGIALLMPIVEAMLGSVRASAVLAMDETPIKAGHKEKRKLGQGYFWPLYGDRDEVVFHYAPSRGHSVVREVLGDYKGILLTDGYSAYERFVEGSTGITHARCWVHGRRYFIDAEQAEPQRAAKALDFIRQLYAVEELAKVRRFSGEGLLALRHERSGPIVDAFFNWLREEQQDIGLLPKNPFTTALCYMLYREHGLRVFLGDPSVPLDTNHLERALRVIPMGRKNWMFCWTEIGAKCVAAIQSLLVTCKLQSVDPYDYLVDVLLRISVHPAKDIASLTPRLWKQHFAANPLRSDLYSCRNNVAK